MSAFKKKDDKKTEIQKVEERREEVLAKGRKFKYPLQWTHHRIVISTIIIAATAAIALIVICWAALYKFGATEAILFNVTKVFPLSVATVDGVQVPFSDYLMLYRSSITSAERQSGGQLSGDLTAISNDYKRSALTDAEKYALALAYAKDLKIEVTEAEVEEEFNNHLRIGGVDRSEEAFTKIINDNFGLTKTEYERMLYLSLARAKVEASIDNQAGDVAAQVERLLSENGNDYAAVYNELGDLIVYEDTGGLVDNKNIDGGRASVAMNLAPGESSGKFISMNGDGYYFVKLKDKTDSKVDFTSIKVPFREFDQRFVVLKEDGKITEAIEIGPVE